jgi:hypothetical protein
MRWRYRHVQMNLTASASDRHPRDAIFTASRSAAWREEVVFTSQTVRDAATISCSYSLLTRHLTSSSVFLAAAQRGHDDAPAPRYLLARSTFKITSKPQLRQHCTHETAHRLTPQQPTTTSHHHPQQTHNVRPPPHPLSPSLPPPPLLLPQIHHNPYISRPNGEKPLRQPPRPIPQLLRRTQRQSAIRYAEHGSTVVGVEGGAQDGRRSSG